MERHSFRIGNCYFPQNLHTRKLGGITVFDAVVESVMMTEKDLPSDCSYKEFFLVFHETVIMGV